MDNSEEKAEAIADELCFLTTTETFSFDQLKEYTKNAARRAFKQAEEEINKLEQALLAIAIDPSKLDDVLSSLTPDKD